jgi:S-formylglutathione hydrolase
VKIYLSCSCLGFYVNATTEGWKNNYQMFDYVNIELPALVQSNFNTNGKMSGN